MLINTQALYSLHTRINTPTSTTNGPLPARENNWSKKKMESYLHHAHMRIDRKNLARLSGKVFV